MGKYLDKIRQHERTQPIESVKTEEAFRQHQALAQIPTIQAGDRIEWQRAGTAQQGLVDFLHCDADGRMWAFCTGLGGSWTWVNCKFVRAVKA
jgi:hypothetical protein